MSKWRKATRPVMVVTCLTLLAACSQYDIFGTRRDIVVDQPAGQSFMSMETTSGKVLTTPGGMTLYTFDKDTTGTSTCYGDCAQNWPPFLGGPDSKEADFLTLTTRTDGTKQWAYDGKRVYRFSKDTKPGDKNGDNFRDMWHVAKP